MEQEQKQNPEIERIALSMQRAAYDYGERITARQLDVHTLTVNSGNGFELTLTDKRQRAKSKDFQTSYNAMSEFFRVGHYFDQQDAERTRTEQLERQKQEQRYLGSLLRLPGMRLYEFNYKTGECREVGTETKLELDVTSGQPVTRRSAKVQWNPDCVYLQALNHRNAIRKLVKAGYVKMVKHDGKGPHVEDR